jgi:NAD(P)H-flavin reductase
VERYTEETTFQVENELAKDIKVIQFYISESFRGRLAGPGAFVFVRPVECAEYFNFPVGIMEIEGNIVRVAIEEVGPKSKTLFSMGQRIVVRGPYYNGILGKPWLDNMNYGKILLLAGGMGQSPALPIAVNLRKNNNSVSAIIAPGRVGKIFIGAKLQNLGCEVLEVSSLRQEGLSKFISLLPGCDLVVSSGPDEQHHGIISAMHNAGFDLPLAVTNNARMCCGEGVCGSCEKQSKSGESIRICKTQTDFRNIVF